MTSCNSVIQIESVPFYDKHILLNSLLQMFRILEKTGKRYDKAGNYFKLY